MMKFQSSGSKTSVRFIRAWLTTCLQLQYIYVRIVANFLRTVCLQVVYNLNNNEHYIVANTLEYNMDVKSLILEYLRKNGEVRSFEIIKATGFSRTYVDRFFRELREEGVLTLIGKANKAKYIPATEKRVIRESISIKRIHNILTNKNLSEDKVYSRIKTRTGIIYGLSENVSGIVEYAFCEMLNNAIEHSSSEKIEVKMERKLENVMFEIRDYGVGIYNNIRIKLNLENDMDAIQDLIKGKLSTSPASHSGEGIFFTSRVSEILTIQSSQKKLIFDNLVEDIFIRNVNNTKGTRVVFSISLDSTKELREIFDRFTDDHYSFSKTEVFIKLYEKDTNYISRSQARRVMTGLEKFKTIILDFKGVATLGQAFADEIFRVWQGKYPEIEIIYRNTAENVIFMIRRALAGS